MILQVEWITQLIEASAGQSFSSLILAVMIGLLCMALGAIWRQYLKAVDIIMKNQSNNEDLVKLLNSRNYDAVKELIVRIESERRMKL